MYSHTLKEFCFYEASFLECAANYNNCKLFRDSSRFSLFLFGIFVLEEPGALSYLSSGISEVAGEEQHVPRLHLPGKPHEYHRVHGQGYI